MRFQLFSLMAAGMLAVGACGTIQRAPDTPPVAESLNGPPATLERSRATSEDGRLSLAVEARSRGSAARGTIPIRVQLRNESTRDMRMMASSGLVFDLEILDSEGDVQRRWSDDRAFTLALVPLEVPAGGVVEEEYELSIEDLALGETYTVVATFHPAEGGQSLRTQPALRIRGSGELVTPTDNRTAGF